MCLRSFALHVQQAAGDKSTMLVLAAYGVQLLAEHKQLSEQCSDKLAEQKRRTEQQAKQLARHLLRECRSGCLASVCLLRSPTQ
jgi:hypothetical protein